MGKILQEICRDAFPVVPYGERDPGRQNGQGNIGLRTAGVAVNICETLLQDPEKAERHWLGQLIHIVGEFDFDFNPAALSKPFQVPLGGGGKACFIQQRRMQQMRNSPRFGYGLVQEVNGFCEKAFLAVRGKHLQVHLHAGKVLPQTVVEFAGKFSAFCVLQLQ